MNRAAICFLILLRFAIGWHFFTEGVQKIQSVSVGETTKNRPFSSAAYFREAPGPAGSWMRSTLGDPDVEALALLTVTEPTGDANTTPPHKSMPPELRRRWEQLLADYGRVYGLTDVQKDEAHVKLDQASDDVVLWLTSRSADKTAPEVTIKFPSGEVKRRIPMAELIADYKARLTELKHVTDQKLWLFGKDVEKAELKQKKADVTARRTLLLAELDKHTLAFLRSLNLLVAEPVLVPLERLDDEHVTAQDLSKKTMDAKQKDALKALIKALKETSDGTKDLYPVTADTLGSQKVTPIDPTALNESLEKRAKVLADQASALNEAAKGDADLTTLATSVERDAKELGDAREKLSDAKALSVETKANRMLGWLDFLTRWGLTVIGLCLMVGLLSRTNAWLAAGFLLMTYLAVPPWPWLPSVGPTEGNYLFVNKNLIEMLALCVLGVTASGRAFGVDAVISYVWTKLTSREKKTPGVDA